MSADPISGESLPASWFIDSHLLIAFLTRGEKRASSSLVTLIRALIPFTRVPSS